MKIRIAKMIAIGQCAAAYRLFALPRSVIHAKVFHVFWIEAAMLAWLEGFARSPNGSKRMANTSLLRPRIDPLPTAI